MAIFSAQLRVVGVYFNREITFDDGGTPVTIETLHNEAMRQSPITQKGGIFFTGSFEQPDGSTDNPNQIRTISHNYPGKYDFNGNGALTDIVDGPTLGGKERPAGIYELSEQLIGDGFGLLAWQYYVMRGGVLVSKTPAERKFNPYPSFVLQSGDEVTWRLVSIAFKPIATSMRERRLMTNA